MTNVPGKINRKLNLEVSILSFDLQPDIFRILESDKNRLVIRKPKTKIGIIFQQASSTSCLNGLIFEVGP